MRRVKIHDLMVAVQLLVLLPASLAVQGWGSSYGRAPLLERYAWKAMDYAYPDEMSRQLAMMKGDFVPENSLPVGMEIWRNKLFVTVPRWRNGELLILFAIAQFSFLHALIHQA